MHKLKVTMTGPADKILVNGVIFKTHFVNVEATLQFYSALPGFVSVGPFDITDPGKITREWLFDSEANAVKAKEMLENEPDSIYTDRVGLKKYVTDNSIVRKIETIPA